MRFKRILAGALTLAILATVTACGGSKPETKPTTPAPAAPEAPKEKQKLQVMFLQDNPKQDVPTKEQVEKWAKEKNVDVVFESATQKDMLTKVTTAIETGSGPDVMITANYGPRLYKDSLLDLSDLATEFDKNYGGFYPLAKEAGLIDGQWKGIPIYIYMHLILYRKDVLEAVGEKQFPDTWEDFARVLAKVKTQYAGKGMDPFGVAYGRSQDGQQFLQGVLWSYGSKMVAEDGKTITFDSPETVAGLKYVVDLYKNGLMPQGVMAWDDSSNNKAMLASQLAFTPNGASVKLAAKDIPDLYPKIGLGVYPKGPVTRATFPGAYLVVVRKNTKNPDLAKDLIRYLYKPENMGAVITFTGGAVGSPLKQYENLPVWKDPDNKAMLDAVATGHLAGWPGPVSRAAAEVESQMVVIDMVGRVINDKLTPEAAVKEAAEKIKKIYAEKGAQ